MKRDKKESEGRLCVLCIKDLKIFNTGYRESEEGYKNSMTCSQTYKRMVR